MKDYVFGAWIDVKSDLPKEDEVVLGYWSDGHVETVMLETVGGSLWHCLDDGEMLKDNPTHWMPKPKGLK